MKPKSLFEKVWEAHTVKILSNGQTQLFVGRHLIHEVTSPQAFGMLREKKAYLFAIQSAHLPPLITLFPPTNQPSHILILWQTL